MTSSYPVPTSGHVACSRPAAAAPAAAPADAGLVAELRAEIDGLREKLREHEDNRRGLLHQQAALRTVIASIPYSVFVAA